MKSVWFLILFGSLICSHCFTTVSGEQAPSEGQETESTPSYSQCKPYVDAALKGETTPKESGATSSAATTPAEGIGGGEESDEDDSNSQSTEDPNDTQQDAGTSETQAETDNNNNDSDGKDDSAEQQESAAPGQENDDDSKEAGEAGVEEDDDSKEENKGDDSGEDEAQQGTEKPSDESASDEDGGQDKSEDGKNAEGAQADDDDSQEQDNSNTTDEDSKEDQVPAEPTADAPAVEADQEEQQETSDEDSKETSKDESNENDDESKEAQAEEAKDGSNDDDSGEDSKEEAQPDGSNPDNVADQADQPDSDESQEEQVVQVEEAQATATTGADTQSAVTEESTEAQDDDSKETAQDINKDDSKEDDSNEANNEDSSEEDDGDDSRELGYVPRSREHLDRILALDEAAPSKEMSNLVDKATQTTLKELKSVYEHAIKPLETLYKYRDLSQRHFGDPEIFSKPMVVFMGPWSGGKSTIINWLLGIQDDEGALRTGADPSPAQFNIMTHGSEDEVLDGTQLAADWTFSGLQKFGQAFLDRLRGRKLPNRLLEKVNLVEIPGILEVRKQVERSFPFNDACQWFIDRADILFLVYDPAKLDIGPETEAILDQLKGRENQVRIILNKADSVKPDELLRLQATLIWNISPLMASAEPPILYVASLWGRPLNPDSPTSLLLAHENHFLKDIRDATDKRVETRIAAARRFAVRVRNHGKMCDCYLNTYNNHRSFFSNKKKISDDIIEHPQNYHIYEGLSTLTNISRYDLPDPDTYKDFFRLNPLWEFPTLASTCTYFRGCPINKLDIAIAYDLPELLGRYRRQREAIITAPNSQGQQQAGSKGKVK